MTGDAPRSVELAVDPARVRAALEQPIYRDDRREIRVCDVIERLQGAGMRAYIIGGGPRDWLLGLPGKDIDLSLDRPVEEAHRVLRAAYPDIDPLRGQFERFGTLRWGSAELGGLDLNILRSWKDIQNDDMFTTTFVARTDLMDDILTRDFSINVFVYGCRERVLVDPLGGGLADLEARALRLVTHRRVLDTSYRTTFRICQFLVRGYSPTPGVLDHLERRADRDIQGMGPRIHKWIPGHYAAGDERLAAFKQLLYASARQPASIAVLDSFFP
jgi:poly(A) polymerase